jgi:hypothetical protein
MMLSQYNIYYLISYNIYKDGQFPSQKKNIPLLIELVIGFIVDV